MSKQTSDGKDDRKVETSLKDEAQGVADARNATAAIAAFLAGPKWPMSQNGRLPSRREWEAEGIE